MRIGTLADAVNRRRHLPAVVGRNHAIELGTDQMLETLDAEEPQRAGVGGEHRALVRRDRQADWS
jgi:hypothetical protein